MIKKIKKKILLLKLTVTLLIISLLFLLLSFKPIHKPDKSILIASEKSEYKNQLVKMLTEELKKKYLYRNYR